MLDQFAELIKALEAEVGCGLPKKITVEYQNPAQAYAGNLYLSREGEALLWTPPPLPVCVISIYGVRVGFLP